LNFDIDGFFTSTVTSAIGAFVGFILALLGDRLIKRKTEQKDMKSIEIAVKKELKKNLEVAMMIKEKYNDPYCNKIEYLSSVWKTIVSSGALFKIYFRGLIKNNVYSDSIDLYEIIDCANSLEHSIELCHFMQPSDDEILRLKKKRLYYADQIINIINALEGKKDVI